MQLLTHKPTSQQDFQVITSENCKISLCEDNHYSMCIDRRPAQDCTTRYQFLYAKNVLIPKYVSLCKDLLTLYSSAVLCSKNTALCFLREKKRFRCSVCISLLVQYHIFLQIRAIYILDHWGSQIRVINYGGIMWLWRIAMAWLWWWMLVWFTMMSQNMHSTDKSSLKVTQHLGQFPNMNNQQGQLVNTYLFACFNHLQVSESYLLCTSGINMTGLIGKQRSCRILLNPRKTDLNKEFNARRLPFHYVKYYADLLFNNEYCMRLLAHISLNEPVVWHRCSQIRF